MCVWNTDETGSLAVEPEQLLYSSLYSSVQQNITFVPWFREQECATAQHIIASSLSCWTVCQSIRLYVGHHSVDMDRAIHRLHGTGKEKTRPGDRPPLADIPLAITEEELNSLLGPRVVMKLQRAGHTILDVWIGTVLLRGFPKAQKRVTCPAISRGAQGVTAGGVITCEEVLSENRADEERKEEERATARAVNQAAKDAAAAARALQETAGGGEGALRRKKSAVAVVQEWAVAGRGIVWYPAVPLSLARWNECVVLAFTTSLRYQQHVIGRLRWVPLISCTRRRSVVNLV